MPKFRGTGRRFGRVAAVTAALTVLPLLGVTGSIANAADALPANAVAPNGSSLSRIDGTGRQVTAYVRSASMDRLIPVKVQLPADTSAPRPTLYLLNGAGGGEDSATWQRRTDVASFFADKNVNVVTPVGGAFSYYTDWRNDDPELGRNKWATFLGEELPPIIDAAFNGNGVNSLAAISMTGTSVLNLAIKYPGLYKSVAGYSGCAETSTPAGKAYIKLVVESRGGADTENMWGPDNDPAWIDNDPVVNAEKLRGTQIYVSNGNGLPGPHDNITETGSINALANQVLLGGAIEGATLLCTNNLFKKLNSLGIPSTFDFRTNGTHSWGYWEDDLHKSWPFLANSLGI